MDPGKKEVDLSNQETDLSNQETVISNQETDLSNQEIDLSNLVLNPNDVWQERLSMQLAEMQIARRLEQEQNERNIIEEQKRLALNEKWEKRVKELEDLNKELTIRMNSAMDSVNFMLNAVGHNLDMLNGNVLMENENLSELISIVSSQDKEKLVNFIALYGTESIAPILQIFLFFFGK